MTKIIESTFITLDGVIGDPHLYGQPYWDEEHGAYAQTLSDRTGALLLGRETYQMFIEPWTSRAGDPAADEMNARPKYVASRTLPAGPADWNATVLEGDAIEATRELKAAGGPDLLKYGTGAFSSDLLKAGLIDELHLWVFPVVAGTGDRLLPGFDMTHFELLDLKPFESGIAVHVLGPKTAG
jgi:dihydrofolate reductase